ncbi:U1 small nuclear ribonucleoprotein C [Malassezia sp. CBS 17886]|nr:U1 small nuclear ribonucleoprotein C [Malassezia sp. CBS 17886]
MGKHYCDYCDVFLTHDSTSVRKAHNCGRNHLQNVRDYYLCTLCPSLLTSACNPFETQMVIERVKKAYSDRNLPLPPELVAPGAAFSRMGYGPPGGVPPGVRPGVPPGMMNRPPPPLPHLPPGTNVAVPPPNFARPPPTMAVPPPSIAAPPPNAAVPPPGFSRPPPPLSAQHTARP